MPFLPTPIPGLKIYEPRLFNDNRGYFFESFNRRTFLEEGLPTEYVQDNQSLSTYGTLRGLHLQYGEYAQSKLVRVLNGRVWDVAIDLRPDSPTFGKHFGIELSSENKRQFFIPKGFAHAFVVLSETAEFFYKCDNFYSPKNEGGIIYNDPELNIKWPIPESDLCLSERDLGNQSFAEYKRKMGINKN